MSSKLTHMCRAVFLQGWHNISGCSLKDDSMYLDVVFPSRMTVYLDVVFPSRMTVYLDVMFPQGWQYTWMLCSLEDDSIPGCCVPSRMTAYLDVVFPQGWQHTWMLCSLEDGQRHSIPGCCVPLRMTVYLDVVFPRGWPKTQYTWMLCSLMDGQRHNIPLCVSEVDKKSRATEEAGQCRMIVTVGYSKDKNW